MSSNLTKAQRRNKLAAAGVNPHILAMTPDQLQARLSQRPARMPNKRAAASRKACRGGQW